MTDAIPRGLGASSVVRADVDVLVERLEPQLAATSGTRLLVAGGGGFLLSMLVDTLLGYNDVSGKPAIHVTAADNFSTGSAARLGHLQSRADFTPVEADVTRPLELMEPSDYVVHGASIASPVIYRQLPVRPLRPTSGAHETSSTTRDRRRLAPSCS